ncbi:MAG: 50S ribosomal protein L5 [Candidatus Nanohaloarchaea archaeon]|nr:50S ribosomal protein L5 [Candidatus Nanohaloarchaea archaeon]
MNPMREIKIHKVTVNIGVGDVGDEVEKSAQLIEKVTGSTAVKTKSGKGAKGFGKREGLEIGAKTTLRGEKAKEVLERLLNAMEENLSIDNFDDQGNFAFGVPEYINIDGVEYDPDIGMAGMDVAVTLERPGFRVKRRDVKSSNIGKSHRISPEEAANFVKNEFGIEVKGA